MGLLSKLFRETRTGVILLCVVMSLTMLLLTIIVPQIQSEIQQVWMQLPFAQNFIGALLGIEIEGEISAQLMQAIIWVHPIVLVSLWTATIWLCTRFPVGEIDRGTIDVLLGWPVSRRLVFVVETMWWLGVGLVMLASGWTGHLVGAPMMDEAYRPTAGEVGLVLTNLYLLYVAVGGLAALVSSLSERRSRAISTVLGVLMASFLLNFVAQFWEPAQSVSFLSLLEYYTPATVISTGRIPVSDALVLGVFAIITWTIAGEVVARRSLCTV